MRPDEDVYLSCEYLMASSAAGLRLIIAANAIQIDFGTSTTLVSRLGPHAYSLPAFGPPTELLRYPRAPNAHRGAERINDRPKSAWEQDPVGEAWGLAITAFPHCSSVRLRRRLTVA